MNIYFVLLRQPRSLDDRRDDPFWEFGSFGSTGCHSANLLHPQTSRLQDGDRLAFVQGGNGEMRVVALTPPIKMHGDKKLLEAMWDRAYRPVPYAQAPVLIRNERDYSDFPAIHRALSLSSTRRTTACGKVSSPPMHVHLTTQ